MIKKIKNAIRIYELYLAGALLFSPIIAQKKNDPIARECLPEIMQMQESAMGIKYSGFPNLLTYKETQSSILTRMKDNGIYIPSLQAIELYNSSTLQMLTLGLVSRKKDIRVIVAHEVGHYYTDCLNRQLGEPEFSFSKDGGIKTSQENADLKGEIIIAEGIAEYFERVVSGRQKINDSSFPQKLEQINMMNSYQYGYCLVKPVIDKHGQKGIEALLKDAPLNEEDLTHLATYRQRIMDRLDTETKNSALVNN